ncbi:MAG: 2-oxo acid dehydrogenase subunit E2, partial [Clostridia bacterium]|nr:2-oxo acid dehydrogenase subunit E2 [Clostridia bacterium]
IVGEKKKRPFYKADGTFEMKDSVNMSLTIDERIADGVYFTKSVKLMQGIMEHPEVLDLPYDAPVEFSSDIGSPTDLRLKPDDASAFKKAENVG